MLDLSVPRLHRWHLHKRSLTCFCHLPSGSDVTVQLQNRCLSFLWPLLWHKQMEYDWQCLHWVNSIVMRLSCTDPNPGMERAWIELEGMEAIVKTASKAKFFIEFHSSCLEGMMSHQKNIFFIRHCCGFCRCVAHTAAEIHSYLSLQRHDAQVRMIHRAVMFLGFSN